MQILCYHSEQLYNIHYNGGDFDSYKPVFIALSAFGESWITYDGAPGDYLQFRSKKALDIAVSGQIASQPDQQPAKKQRTMESNSGIKAAMEDLSQKPTLKRQRAPLPEQTKKLEELISYAKGKNYTLDINLKPTETASLRQHDSKANLKVALDEQTSKACSDFLVDYNIEFSTLVHHASAAAAKEGSTTTKFWIIVSKLPKGSNASCLITISQAGINDTRGVPISLFNSNTKAFMFLLEAIVWIFCFGTALKFDTIEATAYLPSNGVFPSFQTFPKEILRLTRTAATGSFTITSTYASTYNISHIPIEW